MINGIKKIAIILFLLSFYQLISYQKNDELLHKKLGIELDSYIQYKDKIIDIIPQKVIISDFKIETDSFINEDEISYLMGIYKNQTIDADQFILGLDRLQRKNAFASIECFLKYEGPNVFIKVNIKAKWRLSSVKVEGIAFGKQAIAQQYRLHMGNLFVLDKHELALKKIINDLKDEGYYDAEVKSSYEYDHFHKFVNVKLIVHRGDLYTIKSVTFSLNLNLDFREKQKIENLIYKKVLNGIVGKLYSQDLLETKIKALKTLFLQQGFIYTDIHSDIKIENSKKIINLHFTINFKKSQRFVFFGNKFFSSLNLLESIKHCSSAIGILPAVVFAEEITDLYHAHGYFQTNIEIEEDSKNCYFIIDEKSRNLIDNVFIKGSRYVDSSFLIKNFFNHLNKKFINRKKIQKALKRCLDWYKKEGFWDVSIIKKEYILIPDKKNIYSFVCYIDEGKQRILGTIDINGLSDFKKQFILKKFKIFSENQPLTQEILSNQKLIIEQECKKDGFIQNLKISYELLEKKIDQYTSIYDVIWRVKVDKQLRFGKTIFTGNSSIQYQYLNHFIFYKEDQIYQKELISDFYQKLRRTGVFKSVGIKQHFMNNLTDTCDIIVNLEEDDPFEAKLRIGFQQVSKNFAFKKGSSYKLGGSFIWKNPLEKADSVILDIDSTLFERKFSITYKQSLLFNTPLETVLKAYSNSYMQPVSVGSYKMLYEAMQHGLLYALIGKHGHCEMSFASGLEWMKIKNVAYGLISALIFTPELVDETVLYGFCEPTIYFNYLDNYLNPTEGHFTLSSCKFMVPHHDYATSSIKLLFEHGRYASIKSITAVARLKMGHIFMQNFSAIMPSYRFYLGGANSLRGYQTDKCPPIGSFIDDKNNTQWVAQGGKSMMNINFEVRFPLPLQNLQGALFQDFGILAADAYSLFKDSEPVAATGFGLRYITPLGPLRFDIGWKWRKQYEQDTLYAWFLTFGYAF